MERNRARAYQVCQRHAQLVECFGRSDELQMALVVHTPLHRHHYWIRLHISQRASALWRAYETSGRQSLGKRLHKLGHASDKVFEFPVQFNVVVVDVLCDQKAMRKTSHSR